MLNVDPDKQSDQFYRYKMPKVAIKIEGNGNGIKTVVVNIAEICERLARNVEYPMKYFAHELAATAKFKDEKWILTGEKTQEELQRTLFDFIKKFVLCKACRNPETVISVDSKKDLWLNCKACSRITPIDMAEKLCNVLIKNEQGSLSSKKEEKKAKKAGKDKEPEEKQPKEKKSKDEKQEEEFQRKTRQAKDDDTVTVGAAPKSDLPNPVEVLREFVNTEPPPTDVEVSGKVFDMKNDYGFDEKALVALVFESLFDANIMKQIPTRARLLSRFIRSETEKDLIIEIMLLCDAEATLKSKFPMILKAFYDRDVLSEETIVEWHGGKSTKQLSKESQKFFKEKAAPLIEWLTKEDEEDEEDDDEEEGGKEKDSGKASSAGKADTDKGKGKDAAPADDEDIDIDNI